MSVCVAAANKQSLVVDYNNLVQGKPVLAFFLPEAPSEMFKIFDEVRMYLVTHTAIMERHV